MIYILIFLSGLFAGIIIGVIGFYFLITQSANSDHKHNQKITNEND
jgi:uncharacterized protein YneF (UPF0154 family)